MATTFILVKPAKVGEVVYDLLKARKVKTGGKGERKSNWKTRWINIS
ncbi:Transposase [Shouchella clausii]|nr:Transposase [Shouchella clausii]